MADNPFAAFMHWLEEQDRSPATLRAYQQSVTAFAAWFQAHTGQALTPAHLTPLDVKAYRQHLLDAHTSAPASVNRHLASVRAYARWAKRTGQTPHDPTTGIQALTLTDHAPRWLTRAEQWALLRAAEAEVQLGELRAGGDATHPGALWPRRDRALLTLLLHTGLRLAEIASLCLADITLKERSGQVQVIGKGRKARLVPLNHAARQALQDWLAVRPASACAAVFLSQKGGPLSARAITARVATLAAQARLEGVSPHALRHSFAKNLVDAGVGLEKVAKLLGHSRLETTRLYITPSAADLQAATERVSWGE